ncbi:Holliday junction endonuclease RuvC [Desulfacinum hydrothermale DSM 13146]|uniref:Crossover junction endodeoxyribonuclease RuvC n=1 Tax=Desulfacinum hydrothermale DSM 13146 TaxID=1121390 RepID=A0A1W1WZB4_9BACT|nr:Holliday junction endonuclease RuvC [Desulfacinum hydrothermale DSM 13146]
MIRVLGIDPGSRHTGYGVVDGHGNRLVHVTSGTIAVPGSLPFPERLGVIFARIDALIRQTAPHECAVEDVFMSRNAKSALILGQARGAAVVAGVQAGLPVFEYSALQIKQAVAGFGKADKEQVKQMVRTLLRVTGRLSSHAADALAVAVCHLHSRTSPLCRQVGEQR